VRQAGTAAAAGQVRQREGCLHCVLALLPAAAECGDSCFFSYANTQFWDSWCCRWFEAAGANNNLSQAAIAADVERLNVHTTPSVTAPLTRYDCTTAGTGAS
jgi:hypothetical protein